MHLRLYILLVIGLLSSTLGAQPKPDVPKPVTRILFVFDGSQSMYGRWDSGTKIDIAQKMMTEMLDSLNQLDKSTFQLALRVYGHQKPVPPQDCNDTRLEVGFSNNSIPKIKRVLKSIRPKGTTPIARSLSRAANDFPPCDNCRNIIILITDGVESCDEDPCAVSRQLQKKGIILKPFVIGIGLDDNAKDNFECVGNYYDAADEKTFEKVLDVVISQALDNTSAQINLIDKNEKATITDVPYSLYNHTSQKPEQNLVHTFNYKGNPDTVKLDPLIKYDLVVYTVPPVRRDSIQITPGMHNQIGVSAPLGTLELKLPGRKSDDKVLCIVRQAGKMTTLNVQEFNSQQRYIAGKYDLEILTLPRMMQYGVEVNQRTTTTVAIPPPGSLSLQLPASGYGAIFAIEKDALVWVTDLNTEATRQSFSLQPGRFQIIYRAKNAQNTYYSRSEAFTITSGSTTILKMK
ncbi:MAG: hypothetical protein SchgKO_06700 [Schleiferiaceae bacterium]